MVREYLKLARSFNAVLTAVAPVMGAIAMQQYDILYLFLVFLVGFFGHTFGFVFNDIIDYNIDKSSREISDRPLISGTISIKNAWIFALCSMMISFLIAVSIAIVTQRFFPLIVLAISAGFIALYDLISKKFPFTDIFVSLGIFFLVLYGGMTNIDTLPHLSNPIWIVCILAAIQVLFMQIVAGGMKDIENDFQRGVKTLAVTMGVRIIDGKLVVSLQYKMLAYFIQLIDIFFVFLPFFLIWNISSASLLTYFQWTILLIISILMFVLSHKLLTMERFNRVKARKLIGSHYMINFGLVPIMLMTLNPWAGILVFFPAIGFIISNIVLHGTLLQPKTM